MKPDLIAALKYAASCQRLTAKNLADAYEIQTAAMADELDRLRGELAECKRELTLTSATADKMADLLKRTAIALRGPEPSPKSWSWHDLPEHAAAAIAADGEKDNAI